MAFYVQGTALSTGKSYVFMLSGHTDFVRILTECYVFCMDFLLDLIVFFYSTHSFEINLIAGTKEAGDITLQMFVSFGEPLLFNTRRGQTWEKAERLTRCPITNGSAFDIFFFINPEGWEVCRLK